MPSVLALYAGRAGTLATSKGTVRTAIAKAPVSGRARVQADGLAGDEQISPGHGGPAIELVARAAHRVTVADAVRARFGPPDHELRERLRQRPH